MGGIASGIVVDNNIEEDFSISVKEGLKRLSQPKKMYHFADEGIVHDDTLNESSSFIRRAKLFSLSLNAVKQPIYPYELIIGDVPYHEFVCNKELLPPLFYRPLSNSATVLWQIFLEKQRFTPLFPQKEHRNAI